MSTIMTCVLLGLALILLTCNVTGAPTDEGPRPAGGKNPMEAHALGARGDGREHQMTDEIKIAVSADRIDPVYKCGQPAIFIINVTHGSKAVTEGKLKVVFATDDSRRKIAEKIVELGVMPTMVSATLKEPGFLQCIATLQIGEASGTGFNSAAFEPQRIKSNAKIPADFDKFWADGRAKVDAIPMDLKLTPIAKFSNDKQETFKISMANIDNTRIYGYLSVPKGRKPPYPAFVSVPGAGIGAPTGPIASEAEAGALSLFMGVHTHDLGLPVEDYEALRDGVLRNYGSHGVPDPEKYYYRRAILGIDRAVRYLMSRKDWDRKHLVYFGSSQGGGMGLVLAGLNPQFTGVLVNVPAMCNRSAYISDRTTPFAKMVPYFDAVNFARKIRCPVIMSAGFMDRTCTPSNIYAAYNVIEAPKRMFHGPATHHQGVTSFPILRDYFDPWLGSQLGRTAPLPPAAE